MLAVEDGDQLGKRLIEERKKALPEAICAATDTLTVGLLQERMMKRRDITKTVYINGRPVFRKSCLRQVSVQVGYNLGLMPEQLGLDNYVNLFQETDFVLWVFNSLKLCLVVATIQLVLTSLAAYAFSRMCFPGRTRGLLALLVLQVFPNSMALAGYYILIYRFDMADNFLAIVLVLAAGSAFNIWLLKSYMAGIPKELDEAAFVDGASHFKAFTMSILLLAVPESVVIFLFSFIGIYSEYVISSVFLQSPKNFTLAIGLQSFITNQLAAAAVLASLPIMIIFMLL